jgi:hypothetical protein
MAHRATGKVSRIYATSGQVFIRLTNIPADATPQDGYFRLLQSHDNYDALYSLALTAAVNGYDLQIRTRGEIVSTQPANVAYMMVDW